MPLISLEPLGEGWTVRVDSFANDMVFLSGSKAEDAAMRLGRRLAEAGRSAEVRILIRGGVLAARFVFTPATPAAQWREAIPVLPEMRTPMTAAGAGADAGAGR
jgi:hypothetical protein